MPPTTPQPQNFDFIVNPTPQPTRSPLEGVSLITRVAIVGGIIIVLLILFSIAKALLTGPSDVDKFVSIAQDQQQIITIASSTSQKQGISTLTTNSAVTTLTGVTTDQANTIDYMTKNGKKLDKKTLTLKVSPTINEQLTAAAAAGTYDATYKSVMTQQLEAYMRHLQQVYEQSSGTKGHELLTSNYNAAKLLLQQLQTP